MDARADRFREVLLKLFLILMVLVVRAAAAELAPATAIKDIEGVYKHRFMNGIITPGKAPMEADTPYESEDIVEIVRYDDTHLYIRAELQFYNGHTCSIAGMAGAENGRFVYHDPDKAYDGGPSCTLIVTPSQGEVLITDRLTPEGVATCRSYCGARGSLSRVSLPLKTRRPIRYLKRIVQSRQYQKAIADLQKYEATWSSPR